MGQITDAVAAAFRDFETDGLAASGPHDPDKADIRALGPLIEAAIGAAGLGAMIDVTKDTRANLLADLAHPADSVALVYADATAANNDFYVKTGASGAGSWTLTNALHTVLTAAVQPLTDAAAADVAAANTVIAELGRGPVAANLYDPARRTLGSYIDSAGGISSSANYILSDKMRAVVGSTYTFALACTYRWLAPNGTTLVGSPAFEVNKAAGSVITAPTGAAFIQISMGPNADTKQMLVKGSTLPTDYIAAGYLDPASAMTKVRDAVLQALYSSFPAVINIVDATRFTDGYALTPTTGVPYAFANYTVSDTGAISGAVPDVAIPVKAATTYISNTNLTAVYFDQDGRWLAQAAVTASAAFTTPARAAFLRFHLNPIATKNSIMIVRGTVLPATYLPYGYPTIATLNSTARDAARLAVDNIAADDANWNNPALVKFNTSIASNNGAISTTAGYGLTGAIPVTPGDFIALSSSSNGHAFFATETGTTFVGSSPAAAFTASQTDNVLDVTAVASGSINPGQRCTPSSGSDAIPIRQLSGTTGGVGTYLVQSRQTVSSRAWTSANGVLQSHAWTKVPAGAYSLRFQLNPMANLPLVTVRRGKAALVERALFTGQIAGAWLTISTLASGQPMVGDLVTGPGVEPGQTITSIPTNGGTGAYGVSIPQTLAVDTAMVSGLSPVVAAKAYGGSAGYLPLAGKGLIILGDSISYTAGYVPYVLAGTGMALTANHSQPGRTMKDALFSWNGTTATALTAGAFGAASAVLINLGTNDWAGSTPLGTLADAATGYAGAAGTSFYNDCFKAMWQIRQWNPTIKLIAATPLKRGVPTGAIAGQPTYPGNNGIGKTLEQYVQAISEVAEMFAAPVADQFRKSGFSPFNITTLTADGLHPSTATAYAMQAAPIIAALNAA